MPPENAPRTLELRRSRTVNLHRPGARALSTPLCVLGNVVETVAAEKLSEELSTKIVPATDALDRGPRISDLLISETRSTARLLAGERSPPDDANQADASAYF